MNIFVILFMIIGGAAGILSSLYIVVSFLGVMIYKFYRKIKYHISLFD